ncbi:hypothetical protein GCM10022403_018030 [Streptomyces coacervatus]|uniref:Carrier domain-containing protein n=1 Tax=Streptomyces coacervatus TaxID=647381 RepID=A0ABP7H5V0_9ACTN|nr:phosphopantetheine-binding protein [Streptomyces coacervatus]MDF2271574.1 phosphopantetheine-binding protein [Streptomyces coacervatus]
MSQGMISGGQSEYRGRVDGQLNIRGELVELGEVREALHTHESVLDAHVMPHKTGSGRILLVAHVVLDEEHDLADPAHALREYLVPQLTSASIPSKIVLLDSMPLSDEGKVDVGQLKYSGRVRPNLEVDFQEAAGQIEEVIAGIWETVLDLDEVGVHDNFYDLGGDSLTSLEISVALMERLGLKYDDPVVRQILMSGKTVARSAEMVEEAGVRLS